MGEVYCARDARLGRDVAIKVLPPPLRTMSTGAPDARELFYIGAGRPQLADNGLEPSVVGEAVSPSTRLR
jgi:hypothetical protein